MRSRCFAAATKSSDFAASSMALRASSIRVSKVPCNAFAVGVALSVVANIRGIDFSDYDYIVFDEFIASAGERPIKNEFQAFLNF